MELLALAFEVYTSLRRMAAGPYPCILAVEDTGLNWANLPLENTDGCVFSLQLGPDCVLGFQAGGAVALSKTRRRQKRRVVPGRAHGRRELSQHPPLRSRRAAQTSFHTPDTPQGPQTWLHPMWTPSRPCPQGQGAI